MESFPWTGSAYKNTYKTPITYTVHTLRASEIFTHHVLLQINEISDFQSEFFDIRDGQECLQTSQVCKQARFHCLTTSIKPHPTNIAPMVLQKTSRGLPAPSLYFTPLTLSLLSDSTGLKKGCRVLEEKLLFIRHPFESRMTHTMLFHLSAQPEYHCTTCDLNISQNLQL